MGVVRINAIGPGAVEYLLHGCDPAIERGEGVELEQGQEPEGKDRERALDNGVGYFLDADGEPAGRWLGTGMAGLELSYRAGEVAREEDLRAIFGELRFPASERAGSTAETPVYLGRAPRKYRTLAERVEAAFKAEPDATLERQREIEIEVSHNSKSNTAYYDVTFSPVKSASVYYAALLAAGDIATAQAVRDAHDRAVQIAIESAETDVAWAKTGRHGRASKSGRTTGKWEKATGLSAVLFAHHTNRDGEPQLHAHVAVLNRVGIGDGRVFALDGQAFRPVKDAMATAYDRAFEAILSDLTGVVFETRLDRKGREIAGIDPALMEEASTRSREHVEPRIQELMASYEARHGHEPGPKARRAIVDQAVKQTRQPKTGPGGPAAVADWINKVSGRRERLEATLDAVDDAVAMAAAQGRPEPLATGHGEMAMDGAELATGQATGAAMAGGVPRVASHEQALASETTQPAAEQAPSERPSRGPVVDAAREEMGTRAIIAGLKDLQARYPNWRIGGLVAAIDMQLGADVSAVGLGIAERREWVRGLAERALDPRSGFGVVQVSMGDPVPVPEELRRAEDGRSTLRAHIDERYATAEHLGMERRVVAMAQAGGAPRLPTNAVARVAATAERRGLSADQVAALSQILASDRRVEVLVGPAGAGKSHTLGTLARAWSEEHGGRVIGTATAEIATRNLAELGMDAINTRGLLTALDPDANGRVRLTLTEHDLLVVDEAGMATTADLDAVLQHAAAAGAKVVWSGDHYQLAAVEAGGMFAHLAERPGAIELEQVHRFSNQWERDASLRVRTGDATVAAVYADEGRLRTGTVEQMEYLAGRDYLADRIEGVSSLLIVGSNAQADQLSRDIQAQLVELGLVGTDQLARLKNGTTLRVGDLIQARVNDRSLRVDGGVDERGRRREALPVTNRELYTVIGYDLQNRELLARDERGAIAHLPEDYTRDSVSLAYAVTNHAAQGVTVDRGRPLADRSWTRESFYPAATRGRHTNVIYIVTEVAPDAHDPQRVRDTAEARMVQILERTDESKDAALTVLDESELEARSMLTLGEHYDHHAAERGHLRHAALIAQYLGSGADQYEAYGALLGRLRAIELAGHDVGRVLEAAVDRGTFRGSRDLSKVLHWRVEQEVKDRVPEFDRVQVAEGRRSMRPAWEQLAAQHRDRAAATGNARETYLAHAAEAAQARTDELGIETAAAAPEWALAWLGPVPDRDGAPAEYQEWVRHAGEVASYREFRGVPDEQISIGAAPPPSQQLAHELWTRAAAAGTGDPRVVEWREASDAELLDAVARWEREQAWAPPQVAAERGEALALAHDARNDAILGRAQLAAMDPDAPGRSRLEARVHADEVMAQQAEQFARSLDAGYTARADWWDRTAPEREAAAGAQIEMARRGLRPDAEQLEPTTPAVNEHTTPDAQGVEFAEPQPGAGSSVDEGSLHQKPAREPDLDDHRSARQQQGALQPAEFELAAAAAPGSAVSEQLEAVDEAGRQRFQEALLAEHERTLGTVDPERRLDATARDAAVRAHNFETFVADLRAQHGHRLDPEGTASDLELAHRRGAEIAGNDPTTPARAREFDAAETIAQPSTASPSPTTQTAAGERQAEASTRDRSDDRAVDERVPTRTEDAHADLAAAARASRLGRVAREARNEVRGPRNENEAEVTATRTPAADEIDRELAEQEQLELGRISTPAEQARERQQQQELERTRDEGLERD